MAQLTGLDIQRLGGGAFPLPVAPNLVAAGSTADYTDNGGNPTVEVSVDINWNHNVPKVNEKVYVSGTLPNGDLFAQNLYCCGKKAGTTLFASSPEI